MLLAAHPRTLGEERLRMKQMHARHLAQLVVEVGKRRAVCVRVH